MLPFYSISLASLSQAASALGPKKRKANFNDSPLAKTVILPLTEAGKAVNSWVNNWVEILGDKAKSEDFSKFIDGLHDDVSKEMVFEDNKMADIIKELKRDEAHLLSSMKNIKSLVKGISF